MSPELIDEQSRKLKHAESLRKAGKIPEAFWIYRQIWSGRRVAGTEGKLYGEDEAFAIELLTRITEISVMLVQGDGTEMYFKELSVLYAERKDLIQAAHVSLRHIRLMLACGWVSKAEKMFQQCWSDLNSRKLFECSLSGLVHWESVFQWSESGTKERAELLAHLSLVMGQLKSATGMFQEARYIFDHGLQHLAKEKLAWPLDYFLRLACADALVELGEHSIVSGELSRLGDEIHGLGEFDLALSYKRLAVKFNRLRGDWGTALVWSENIYANSFHIFSERIKLAATLELAYIRLSLNQNKQAAALLYQAVALAEKLGEEQYFVRALFDAQRADNLSPTRQAPISIAPSATEAQEGWRRILIKPVIAQQFFPEFPRGSSYLAYFEDLVSGFYWYLEQKNSRQADHYLLRIKEVVCNTDSALMKAKFRLLEGEAAFYLAKDDSSIANSKYRFAKAEKVLNEALPDLKLKPDIWNAQRLLIECKREQEDPRSEIVKLVRANEKLQEEMSKDLQAREKIMYWLDKWTADEEWLRYEAADLSELENTLKQTRFPAVRRWQIRWKIHKLLLHIDRYKPDAQRAFSGHRETEHMHSKIPTSTFWHRLWRHPVDRATISYLVLPDRVLAIRSGWGWEMLAHQANEKIGRKELCYKIEELHQLIHKPLEPRGLGKQLATQNEASNEFDYKKSKAEVDEIATDLAEILRLPILLKNLPEESQKIDRLTIVPDDSLHILPFAALRVEGKYLVDNYALSLSLDSNHTKWQKSQPQSRKALLVGVSKAIYDDDSSVCYGEIRNVLKEIEKIEKHIKLWLQNDVATQQKPKIDNLLIDSLLNERAVRKDILKLLPEAAIAHFACHGLFRLDHPADTGLKLISSLSNGQGKEKVEALTLSDLATLQLSGLQHVTFSSCWAADSFILPGRCSVSIPQVLRGAGVQSVLGCLWEADDYVAGAFMDFFYSLLNCEPRDKALQKVQMAYSNMSNEYSHPCYWAGYSLYGNYERIQI